jgi:alpha-L-fucosidase
MNDTSSATLQPSNWLARRSKLSVLLAAAFVTVQANHAATGKTDSGALAATNRLDWWRNDRFGMFIHWGPVSIKGTEIGWSRGQEVPTEVYDNLYRKFNPTNFSAQEWMKIAQDAGMKYVVFTTKHHDGFAMWDTKQTDFNVMRSPFGRDVVKELSAACKKQGLVFGMYHSICDWHHPDYPMGSPGGKSKKPNPNMDRYNQYLKNELQELLTGYGRVGVLWFDGEWEEPWTAARALDLDQFCRRLQPSIIINNRVGKGRIGMAGTTDPASTNPGDYDTPEQRIGKFQMDPPWETCMTICQQWAWKPADRMKSLKECLQTLILCAGGDGNLLFNVGPMPDGRIEPRQMERLHEMGQWLGRYGESIYGTRGGPWMPSKAIASTRKGESIYLHLLNCKGGTVTVPKIPVRIKNTTLLTGGKLTVMQAGDQLQMNVPAEYCREIDTIVKFELDEAAANVAPASTASPTKATASNVFQQMPEHGADMAFDGDEETRWATDSGTKQAWVALDLGKTTTIHTLRVREAFPGRVQKFEFQAREGNEWKTVLSGTTLGESFSRTFPPVAAREIRLNILDATEGPTIWEISVE